jgi:hypothetical protein
MRLNGLRISLATSFATVIALLVMPTATMAADSNDLHRDLHRAREATEAYRSLAKAQAAGYGLFADVNGIACIDNPGVGAMGIHYVKGDLVTKAVVDVVRPQALVYEPGEDGKLRLVALEYIVFADQWDSATPPTLFGHRFGLVPSNNRFGPRAFYELHAWVWKHNPSGMFYEWNPRVSCSEED